MASNNRKKAMNMEIAERLVAMRREKGLSQEELAGQLELSRQAISKWERGESAPDMGNLVALADLYGVSLDELIRGKAPESASDGSEVEKVDVTINTYINDEKARTSGAVKGAVVTEVQANGSSAPAAEQSSDSTAPAASPAPESFATASPSSAAAAPAQTQACPPPPQTAPVYTAAAPGQPSLAPKPASEVWMTFPYPLFVVLLYLVLGFVFGLWHPAWIVFLTIPFFYWIVHVVKSDPNYIATHTPDASSGTPQGR